MTGLDWYNVAPIFLWEKNVTNFSDYFSENSEICQNYRHSRWLNFQKIIRFHKIFTKSGSVLREWILKVREVKSEMKIWFTHFEKWKVKWKSVSLISRMKSEMKMPWDRDREWKVKWKSLKIEIENEKWNEIASRLRSRSEISREFSRNSWESRNWEILKFWSKWFSFSKLLLLSKMWICHDKIRSYMHNFTLFSREKEWNLKCFHSFRELKSEFCFPFTHFENEKWNENALRSRMKSEMKMPRDRDQEVKCQQNSREFSRNETLAGYWKVVTKRNKNWKEFLSPELVIFSSLKNSPISSNHQNFHQNWWQKNTKLGSIIVTRIGEIFVT